MRRVVLLMFGAGVLAVLAIWHMEVADGTIDPFNRFGYPAMVLDLQRQLRWRCGASRGCWSRCAGSASCASRSVLLIDLWGQMHVAAPLLGNYNALTLLNWLPLCYAMAFFMLRTRQAFVAAAAILAFFAVCALLRGAAPTRLRRAGPLADGQHADLARGAGGVPDRHAVAQARRHHAGRAGLAAEPAGRHRPAHRPGQPPPHAAAAGPARARRPARPRRPW